MSTEYSKDTASTGLSVTDTVRATIVEHATANTDAISNRAMHIASGIKSLTVQNVVNSVLGYIFLTLLLRLLSPSEYGLYSSVFLVMGIGSTIAFFGLQSAATRFVAFTAHDEGESRIVSRSIVLLSLMITSIATIVFVLISPNLSLYFTGSTSATWVFAASSAWLFSNTISGIFQGLVQGLRKYESLARILISANIAMVCVTVVGLLELHSVIVPITAWVSYGAVICFCSLLLTRERLLVASPGRSRSRSFNQVLRYSLPLGVAGILTVVTGSGDPIIVGGFLSQAQLGQYFAAIAISGGLGAILFTPLNTAFFPETSSDADDPKKLTNGLRLAIRYTLLALIPVSFALAALSRQMISLFSGVGTNYLGANASLQMMSIFFLFVAMQGILTSLLLSTGKTTQVVIIGAVTVVLDIALSLLLIPNFGLIGAATSRILVDIAGFLVALYLTKNYLVGVSDIGFQTKILLSSFIMLAVLYLLSTYISDRALTLIPYGVIAGAIMLLCARVMHLLTEEDKQHIEHLVPPPMGKFVRDFL